VPATGCSTMNGDNMSITDDTYYKVLRDEWLLCSRRAFDLQSWTLTLFVAVFGYGLVKINWFTPKPEHYVAAALLLLLAQFFNLVFQSLSLLLSADMVRLTAFLWALEEARGIGQGWEHFSRAHVHPAMGRSMLWKLPNNVHGVVSYMSLGALLVLLVLAPSEVRVHMVVAGIVGLLLLLWSAALGRRGSTWQSDYATWVTAATAWLTGNTTRPGDEAVDVSGTHLTGP
jgi:hypothetical protein